MKSLDLKNPLIFSLDVSDLSEAEKWICDLGSLVGCIKLGPRLLLQASKDWIQNVSQVSPLFMDCKFFDIPSTMIASVETCFHLGASLVTVHSLCGKPTLKEMSSLQKTLSQSRPFMIVPVTLLTSFSNRDLVPNFAPHEVAHHVEILMDVVVESGLSAVVCSPQEAQKAREKGLLPITPGIRSMGEVTQDQNRVMSAQEALNQGAWGIVVGRSILHSSDPKGWVTYLLRELGY